MNAYQDDLQSEDLELALIGALLINPAMLDEPKVQRIADNDLSVRAFGWLTALRAVYERTGALDVLILKAELSRRFDELGGYPYLGKAQAVSTSSLYAPVYAGTLLRASRERRKRALAGTIAKGGDVTEAVKELQTLSIDEDEPRGSNWKQLVRDGAARQAAWQETPSWVRGWETGIAKMDRVLGGINTGLVSIYGATSMGKSTLARQFAVSFARQGASVVIAPTEMTPSDVLDNLAGEMAGIPVKQVRSGYLSEIEQKRLHRAMQELYKLHIIPLDDPSPTPAGVKAFVEARIREGRCNVLIVDSGSNLKVPEGHGEVYDETRIAAGVLKDIAYEHDIPVVTTWQTGRNDKNRSPIPRIGDAKGASDVEYNSHVVIGIFRPYYYRARGIALPEQYMTCQPTDSYLSILKDRSGGAGDDIIPVTFVQGRGFVGVIDADAERHSRDGGA